jgi:hypothetical protein
MEARLVFDPKEKAARLKNLIDLSLCSLSTSGYDGLRVTLNEFQVLD